MIDGNYKLSEHFTVKEFTKTSRGAIYVRKNIEFVADNLQTMKDFAENVLEKIRAHVIKYYKNEYGINGLKINSGIRCPELNNLLPNASKTSQHLFCEAADIWFPNKEVLCKVALDIKNGKVEGLDLSDLSQVIIEKKTGVWLHVGYYTPRWEEFRKSRNKPIKTVDWLGTYTGFSPYYRLDENFVKKFLEMK